MAICQACGRCLAFEDTRNVRELWVIADLLEELQVALSRAGDRVGPIAPEAQSALVALRPKFSPLIIEASVLIAELRDELVGALIDADSRT